MRTVPRRVLALLGSYILCTALGASLQQTSEFAVGHLRRRGAVRLTFVVCSDEDLAAVMKSVSATGIQVNFVNPTELDRNSTVSILTSVYVKIGILLEMGCDSSKSFLKIAHEKSLFTQKKSMTTWIIVMESSVPDEVIQTKARLYEPEPLDPIEYLSEPYENSENAEKLKKVGFRYNAEIIEEYLKRKKAKPTEVPKNASGIDVILPMNMLADSDVTLAVPSDSPGSEIYRLYRARKVAKEAKMKILRSGTVFADGENIRVEEDTTPKRQSLEGAVYRSTTGIFSIKTFTRIDDLLTRDKDTWSKLSYEFYQLMKNDLNFSSLIRFFDDYGWLRNGSFTAMVGQLEKGKADMSTSMMIIRDDRSRVLDFLDAYYRLQTGVLFREPPLASVSNIFLLPFSRDVWIGVVVLTVLIIAALELEAVAGTRRQWRRTRPDHVEIVFSVFYAIAQKSYYWIPVSTAGRLIFFILFTTCLALFTAFSAKIVTVMQSSSSSIDDIEDLTHSSFQFGMQTNFPLFLVTLEDAIPTQRVIREFYREKVMKNMKELYLEPEIGIERIRRGLFAYEVELPAGYTLISETFEEAEKCGIRELDLFPKPYLSTVLPKYSPLRQIFSPRMRWMAETGHTARIWQRWMPQKPKCEMERIGFISVGLLECHHAILIFMYGAAAAVLIMTGEIVYRKVSMRTQQKKGLEARARLSTEITG